MPASEPWPAVPAPADPVEFWLQRARCCGAPQLCGAVCMDDEESATQAQVVRRLDSAEAALARVAALAVASDDGTEYQHNGHPAGDGEPECPACWAAGIRYALGEGQ
jgi:hypothetical protein